MVHHVEAAHHLAALAPAVRAHASVFETHAVRAALGVVVGLAEMLPASSRAHRALVSAADPLAAEVRRELREQPEPARSSAHVARTPRRGGQASAIVRRAVLDALLPERAAAA